MPSRTAIEWTDATWNPFQGCTKVDGDCKFCYMYREKARYGQDPTRVIRSSRATFDGILSAKKYPPGSLVFSASWADWWHPDCDQWRAEAWVNVDKRRDLTFQILTKRPERIPGTLPSDWGAEGWPNVWLGTSVGSPRGAPRAEALAEVPAVVRFLSIEPLWAPGVADAIRPVVASGRIDWIILGGESGFNARPMHPAWAREVRDLAEEFNVPLLFKQWGEWAPWFCEEDFTHGGPERRAHMWLDRVSGERGDAWVYDADGTWQNWTGEPPKDMSRVATFSRPGKKAAGRTLDGVVHDAYPTPRRCS